MARTVLVVTDRPTFAAACEALIAGTGVELRRVAPSELHVQLVASSVVIVDGESAAYSDDSDELLVGVGLARALSCCVAVIGAPSNDAELSDILNDLCPGMGGSFEQLPVILPRLLRRADISHGARFEYLTVSPRAGELLAILSGGQATLLPRPCADGDDGSDIVAIDLGEDALRATITLESGAELVLTASAIMPTQANGLGAMAAGAPALDGAKVGSRLRQLRKEAGLTQAELARRTGIHRPNIARVEAGRHTPSLDTLARIAAAIGVPATRVLSVE